MKYALAALILASGISMARLIAEQDYWIHHRMSANPVCEEPNALEALLNFPPKCHYQGE